jgi:DNA (cytosine-5)-methyltransferase 1
VQSFGAGLEGLARNEHDRNKPGWIVADAPGPASEAGYISAWSRCNFIECADGKTRRAEPGIYPLAHGVPGRVGLLRGYGNAIVPQVAAEFVQAVAEIISK